MNKETLEEAAYNYVKSDLKKTPLYGMFNDTFIEGAKWQAEQDKNMYSEEEVLSILKQTEVSKTSILQLGITKWFEQFKKNKQ